MSRVHSLILTAAAIAMLATAVSCAGGDDGIGPIRHPEAQAGGDPFDCHDFDAEAADRTTRFTAPGLSLHYTPGVIIERRNGAITFTDIASGHRAALDFTTDTGSLTVDGQPVALAAWPRQRQDRQLCGNIRRDRRQPTGSGRCRRPVTRICSYEAKSVTLPDYYNSGRRYDETIAVYYIFRPARNRPPCHAAATAPH